MSGINRGGKPDDLRNGGGGRISWWATCRLQFSMQVSWCPTGARSCGHLNPTAGLSELLNSGLHSSLSLYAFYQLPRHLSGVPALLAGWENLSHLFILSHQASIEIGLLVLDWVHDRWTCAKMWIRSPRNQGGSERRHITGNRLAFHAHK